MTLTQEMTLTDEEYRAFLRNYFSCFVERSFYELNPQAKLS